MVCTNKDRGCTWRGELGSIESHLESEKGCVYVEVKCPNNCCPIDSDLPKKLLRKDLKNHLQNDCDLRPYECEYCGYKDTYQVITGEGCNLTPGHYTICPKYPLKCPNGCDEEEILRKDMEEHRNKCPREKVCCTFKEAGCQEVMFRNECDEHVSVGLFEHVSILMTDYKKTKMELKETQEKLAEMRLALHEKEEELFDIQEEMEQIREEQLNLRGDVGYVQFEVHLMKKEAEDNVIQTLYLPSSTPTEPPVSESRERGSEESVRDRRRGYHRKGTRGGRYGRGRGRRRSGKDYRDHNN